MKQDHLSRAGRLIRRGNYDGAIKLLETEVNRYHDSYTYFYLLAVSYLYSDVYGMAYTYFNLARKIKIRDVHVLLGLACIYLNHGDTDRAVDLYLEVQELEGKNPTARKALKIIRKYPGPENISKWKESGRLRSLYPPLPKKPLSESGIILFAAAAALAIGLCLLFFHGGFTKAKEQRKDIGALKLVKEDEAAPMQVEGSYRYVLTRDEVIKKYDEARRFFNDFRDEEARVRLNHILESNAQEPVKNKARDLIAYLEVPGFDNLKDRFTYSQVIGDPFLYKNCAIHWRGIASNLDLGQNHTSFYFLAGYDTRTILEGIVRVDYNFAVSINPEHPLEILGKVIPDSSETMGIRIQGIAVKQTGLLDQAHNR
ncbi:MAG: tetratricopeptide repeat protein [Treponema sp.]|jgi:hypothetical protein|nr:tetratricopeptide repeat protein [Treponema sp.]